MHNFHRRRGHIQGQWGGGRGVINRDAIKPSDKAEKNIFHLLQFLPVPVSPTLPPCFPVPAINISSLCTWLNINIHSIITAVSKTRSINGGNNMLMVVYYHSPYVVIASFTAVSVTMKTSSSSSNKSHYPTFDRYMEGLHHSYPRINWVVLMSIMRDLYPPWLHGS